MTVNDNRLRPVRIGELQLERLVRSRAFRHVLGSASKLALSGGEYTFRIVRARGPPQYAGPILMAAEDAVKALSSVGLRIGGPYEPVKLMDVELDAEPRFDMASRDYLPDALNAWTQNYRDRPIWAGGLIDASGAGRLLMLQRDCKQDLAPSAMPGLVEEFQARYSSASFSVAELANVSRVAELYDIPGCVRSSVLQYVVPSRSSYATVLNPGAARRFAYTAEVSPVNTR